MTYREVAERLGITGVCYGGCGLNAYRHRGTIFLGVIHWQERRMTRRGLRRFLLLAARRDREVDVTPDETAPVRGWSNARRFTVYHLYADEMAANAYARRLGVRFPIAFSREERFRCWLGLPRDAKPAIQAWARKGFE